jgi:hypothetical protein
MLTGRFNQRIREISYFFTIVYFTAKGDEGEGGKGAGGREMRSLLHQGDK